VCLSYLCAGEDGEGAAESDLQLAWENLEAAKAIWAQQPEQHVLQLAGRCRATAQSSLRASCQPCYMLVKVLVQQCVGDCRASTGQGRNLRVRAVSACACAVVWLVQEAASFWGNEFGYVPVMQHASSTFCTIFDPELGVFSPSLLVQMSTCCWATLAVRMRPSRMPWPTLTSRFTSCRKPRS